ncbi:baseplate J/gp47 family protein [Dyella sp. EPa41]|uniref:baseplate J/gp47 family protein n=1 Tax=Dyella sp. EPa41 TaxID=1561194 RepID=UPI0019166B87|nr:baseplate J/gp47 family protein [Dyella sp. EPa41]
MSCCSACGQHACACGCGASERTPLPLANRPGLSSLAYRVGTYAEFFATMQMDLSSSALPALTGLRTRELDDPSMALVDAWAIGADVLSFYQERIANEGYLRTATERCSVLQLGRLVDYRLRPGVAASVYLAYTIDDNSPPVTIPAGAKAQSVPAPGEQMQTFETAEPLDARHEWNTLRPRQTQPQNITLDTIASLQEVWLAGGSTQLRHGDRLLFQFGELATGTSVLRRVESVDVQQTDPATGAMLQPADQSSRVRLQALGAVTVAIVAAANRAVAALASGDARWFNALLGVRQQLLLGVDDGGSAKMFSTVFMRYLEGWQSGPAPVQDFMKAVDEAFGGPPAAPPPAAGFGALFDALILPRTLQPANSLRLQRGIATVLAPASDARPQLLLNFATPLLDTFYRAWTAIAHGNPSPDLLGVFALRVKAPLFGYNAPAPMTVNQKWDGSQWVSTMVPGSLDTSNEVAGTVWLDNAYDDVEDGSYAVIWPPGNHPVTVRLSHATTAPHSMYTMSGKSTRLDIDPNQGDHSWSIGGESDVRGTQVYAQSEPLTLAATHILDQAGNATVSSAGVAQDGATRMTLDQPVDGLKPGRWVVVQGQRADVPGTDAVNASEAVMLLAVEQAASSLPGDTIHSTLVFAGKGLAYAYVRGSVSVYANVVRATHGETRNEVLGNGNGATAMPTYALKQSPLTYVSAPTVDGVQSTLVVSVNGMQWHEARNLAFVGVTSRSYATSIDDSGKVSVLFGNGVHGARVPTGIENITAVYRQGIGTPGNVQAGQISLAATRPLGVKQVVNPLRASGGADPETRDQARVNVPLAVLALDRLVSITDYADFSRTYGGVGKACAIKLGSQVLVTIAGAGDAPIDDTSDLYGNLLQSLQQFGDPSLPVTLMVRQLVALTLSARVGLAPDVTWETVEPVIRAALLDRYGFENAGLAKPVYLSGVVSCIQAVRGVAWVDVDAFGSLDEAALLLGFGVGSNGGGDDGAVLARGPAQAADPATPQRITVLDARLDSQGNPLPAQIAYFLPAVPDTLLLQQATP